jgi:hypothetical protein
MNEDPRRTVSDAAGADAANPQKQNRTASPPRFQSHHSGATAGRTSIDDMACQFLWLILPDRGPYIVWINSSNGRKYNHFASTIEELWEVIKAADRAGYTAYHACASFKEAKRDPRGTPRSQREFGRKKQNARGAKSFWLDVDAGPDKPYADSESAAQAVALFCSATGLPPPLFVFSGLGLHVYWPLRGVLERATWEQYARGLKALCVERGLHADPSRTADITSVLRTPGTHHRKAGVRLVRCRELVGPYPLKQFEILLSTALDCPPKGPRAKAPKGFPFLKAPFELPPYLSLPGVKDFTETLARNLSSFEPSSGALIARRCPQIRALRDSKGNLSEPLWYASLGVLAFAHDGELLGHEWSSGDPRYTECETQERLERARQLSGPTTCQRFHDLKPEVCIRCKWWGQIKSPIALGQRRSDGGVPC